MAKFVFRTSPRGGWFEQEAASRLLHEAFHGLKPYTVTPLSENIYNCEDDDDREWFNRIEKYHPKLIHFKSNKWKQKTVVDTVMALVQQYQTQARYVESPPVFMQEQNPKYYEWNY